MAAVRALDAPPPPSSVVTKILSIASAAVSHIPTAPISSMRME
jgi:hypothetical protein